MEVSLSQLICDLIDTKIKQAEVHRYSHDFVSEEAEAADRERVAELAQMIEGILLLKKPAADGSY